MSMAIDLQCAIMYNIKNVGTITQHEGTRRLHAYRSLMKAEFQDHFIQSYH